MGNLAIVVPAYNEAEEIENVILAASLYGDVIVVDDGSSDDTNIRAKKAKARVIVHSKNRGYEAALETGMQVAVTEGYLYAITLDADGQHDPVLIKQFADMLLQQGMDLVVGDRDVLQRWSEVVFSKCGSLLWNLTDPLSGMKGYRLSWLIEIGAFDTRGLVGTELAVKMIVNGAKFSEIPILTRARTGESRYGDGFWANMKIIKSLIVLIFLNKARSIKIG
jgi:glycosyltransferase involved in cell wall biosynthesis